MAKNFVREQYASLTAGDLLDHTKQLKAQDLLSKGLKQQGERERKKKLDAKIQKIIRNETEIDPKRVIYRNNKFARFK